MSTFIMVTLIIGVFAVNVVFAAYILASCNILFTRVPAGEIIVVTVSEKAKRFIGNIEGFWVNPQTGEVFDERDGNHPRPKDLPKDFFGTGIYWLGIWPLYERYHYEFHWNKYAKKKDSSGKDLEEYEIVPKHGIVDSIYFRASYPIRVIKSETIENVPLTLSFLITTETVNAEVSLFKAKSPGWLASLTASVTAVLRDFNGKSKTEDMVRLQAELPNPGTTDKTELQKLIELLNESSVGNPSVIQQFGQKIVSINFLDLKIEEPETEVQRQAIANYNASRQAEALITAEKGKADAAEQTARGTITKAKAEAEAIAMVGEAKAKAAKQLAEAVSNNPHASAIAIAEAIREQQHATTLIIGQGVLPTKAI